MANAIAEKPRTSRERDNFHARRKELTSGFRPLKGFEGVRKETIPRNALDLIRKLAPEVRSRFAGGPVVDGVRQFICSIAPYPTVYGFHTIYSGISPYLWFKNRATLVQFISGGKRRLMLFNPIFPELSEKAPFFVNLKANVPSFLPESLLAHRAQPLVQQLQAAGIDPGAIDYIAYDHLHVQDIRPLIGEGGMFPNAILLVHEDELTATANVHPTVAEWYVPGGIDGIDHSRVFTFRGDLSLGEGVALLETIGHTPGNQSLYLNTSFGTMTFSENGVGVDSYDPQNSRVPGIRKRAAEKGWEVVLNANTIDMRFDQYNSMIKEKLLAGRSYDPDFCNHHATSEFTTWAAMPALRPSFEFEDLRMGSLDREVSLNGSKANA